MISSFTALVRKTILLVEVVGPQTLCMPYLFLREFIKPFNILHVLGKALRDNTSQARKSHSANGRRARANFYMQNVFAVVAYSLAVIVQPGIGEAQSIQSQGSSENLDNLGDHGIKTFVVVF